MELYAHFIMFNVVSRSISQVKVPQADHKYEYSVNFKMACKIVHCYYRFYNKKSPNKLFTELVSYINPVRKGRTDRRNLKPKSAVWFVYRIA